MEFVQTLLEDNEANYFLFVLFVLTVLDIFLGFSKAFVKGDLSSTIGRKGVVSHTAIFTTIFTLTKVAEIAQVDQIETAMNTMICFLGLSYVISIVENLSELGAPIPASWKEKLKKLRDS